MVRSRGSRVNFRGPFSSTGTFETQVLASFRKIRAVFAEGRKWSRAGLVLIALAWGLLSSAARGQANEWTWMGGSSTVPACSPESNSPYCGQPGVYGTLQTPAAANLPGSRQPAASWTDSKGNFWLFGGYGYATNGPYLVNDLWEFSPATGEWAWMSGTNTVTTSGGGQAGVYGTLGQPAAINGPGGRYGGVGWTDSKGDLWLFGGWGCDSATSGYPSGYCYFNDVWEFNPSSNEWAWMGGSQTVDQQGVYGTLGTPAAGNIPGGRENAVSWTDSKGNFWLFGGYGYDSAGTLCFLSDLWQMNPATGEWAWMGGSSTIPYDSGQSGVCNGGGERGVYGTLGTPASANTPGSRESAVSWTDNSGNLWLFGGYGADSAGAVGFLNDLWEFNPSSNQWTWVAGPSALAGTGGLPGAYETWMIPSATNYPGGRQSATGWTGTNGNLWLFGGYGYDSTGSYGYLNDLWEFNPSTRQWTWMDGSNAIPDFTSQPGVYGTLQPPALMNTPGGRSGAAGWTDKSGNLWLYGGFDPAYWVSSGLYQTVGFFNDVWEYQTSAGSLPIASTPSFSPETGTYAAGETLTISDTTPGAVLYYFASGSVSATQYTQPIALSSTETLEAVAVAPGYANSAVASATFTVPIAAAPTFSIAPGTYSTAQTVSISTTTPGATIYYALNWQPTTSSSVYSGPITVSSSETIEAMAAATGYTNSATATASYTIWPISATNEWAWMGGLNTNEFARGIYGTLGVPAAGNFPGTHQSSSTWTDSSGNLWLFGGLATDANGNTGSLMNDLWKFNPSTNQWTWMGGSSSVGATSNALEMTTRCNQGGGCAQPGVYGTLGTQAAGNIPGGREGAASWTDANGNFWLLGGYGYDSIGTLTELNDLWEFSPSTNEWAWMGGSSIVTGTCFAPGSSAPGTCAGEPSVYGNLGTPAAGNSPGARQDAISWTDSKGNLWLFGGWGWDLNTEAQYYFDELWEFNPSTRQWAWMGGSNTRAGSACFQNPNNWFWTCGEPGAYGAIATPSPGDIPGGRAGATGWTDNSGNLWLFGGDGFDSAGAFSDLNDLWELNPSTSQWAWMGGGNSAFSNEILGTYGTQGTPAAGNVPHARLGGAGWVDSKGDLWLFGGVECGLWESACVGFLDDLWEFDPPANEWTWMGGGNGSTIFQMDEPGVYGSLGTPAAGNVPGARYEAAAWTDTSGYFWLLGGSGYNLYGPEFLNDSWRYRPAAPSPVPGFALADLSNVSFFNADTLTVAAGTSGVTTINSMVSAGFTGAIALSASNLPAGVTASFSPATLTGFSSSQLTFTVALNATPGEYTITVAGTSGGVTETTSVNLTVSAYLPQSFTMTPSPGALILSSGSQGTTTLTVFAWNGFTSAVSFACSGLPAGASCSFSPATVTPSGATATTTLTISAGTQAAALRQDSRSFLPATVLAGLVFLFGWRKRRRLHAMAVLLAAVLALGLMGGCGGGGSSGGGGGGSLPVNATVTVTGTSGSLQASTTISLTIN